MGSSIDVDIRGVNEAIGEIRHMTMRVEGAVREVVATAAVTGHRMAVKAVQGKAKDTGALSKSIQWQITNDGFSAQIRTRSKYAEPTEFGRRPGARMPPASALVGWSRRKIGDGRLAFVVARSIGEKGLPERPFMRPGATIVAATMKRDVGKIRAAAEG